MLKTSGEFFGFDQAGEGASGNGVPVGTVLLASDPRSAPSWEAEAQRQDLNPGKAKALPSPVGCPACLPPRSFSGRCPLIWGKLPGQDKTPATKGVPHPGWGSAIPDCSASQMALLCTRLACCRLGHSAWTLPLLSPG